MVEVPISLFLSLLIVVALVRYTAFSHRRIGWIARAALATLALQSGLLGLRWGYQIQVWPDLQAVIASLIPPLVWLALNSMISSANWRMKGGMWLHLVCPPLATMLAYVLMPDAVDIVICLLFLGYGTLLLYSTFKDDIRWLESIPFEALLSTNMAFRIAGGILIFSAMIDAAVAFDLSMRSGTLAPSIVGMASLAIIFMLFSSIAIVGRIVPAEEPSNEFEIIPEEPVTDKELHALHADTLKRLDALMISKRIYRDPNLSLNRMARKLMVPSRQISAAINTQRAMNVPQYVNMFRIMEACERLRSSSAQITQVVFDVGFQTKSNFNREFQRIVCMSPSDWRQRGTEDAMPENMKSFQLRLQSSAEFVFPDTVGLLPPVSAHHLPA